MLAFASSVLGARAAAHVHDAVATFGKVKALPDGANAVPSEIKAPLDARTADETTSTKLVQQIQSDAHRFAESDSIALDSVVESVTPIVQFPDTTRQRLDSALSHLGGIPVLPTAGGHEAAILSAKVPTAMLFA